MSPMSVEKLKISRFTIAHSYKLVAFKFGYVTFSYTLCATTFCFKISLFNELQNNPTK